ncbi:MAG: histidine phosphatase family protein [Rhodobacteraceae bacterium]|nr:histidine phosphatase family protein [Paracoccaceae bacterium]PHR61751.1 MAG: phosphoglycerate mutase [Robiginitomaculum sp.]
MSLTLILTRHAKSDWNNALADQDRPLNGRGRANAPLIGAWLAGHGHVPDLVMCSNASRTTETLALISPAFADAAPILCHLPSLYHASATRILGLIQRSEAAVLMVVGHNPGIGELAHQLATAPPSNPGFSRYPTAATTVLRFDAAIWADVKPGAGEVIGFITPRELS